MSKPHKRDLYFGVLTNGLLDSLSNPGIGGHEEILGVVSRFNPAYLLSITWFSIFIFTFPALRRWRNLNGRTRSAPPE